MRPYSVLGMFEFLVVAVEKIVRDSFNFTVYWSAGPHLTENMIISLRVYIGHFPLKKSYLRRALPTNGR